MIRSHRLWKNKPVVQIFKMTFADIDGNNHGVATEQSRVLFKKNAKVKKDRSDDNKNSILVCKKAQLSDGEMIIKVLVKSLDKENSVTVVSNSLFLN